MASPDVEDYGTLHERVLRFMGAFSSTQFAIDTVLSLYLHRRTPLLGAELTKGLRDNQRPKLFLAYAEEVSYDADLTEFSSIYTDCKNLRDYIGHSLAVTGPVYSPSRPPVVAVTHTKHVRPGTVPDPIVPSTFDHYSNTCELLSQHVWRAGYVGNPDAFVDFEGQPAPPPRPAPLPVGD